MDYLPNFKKILDVVIVQEIRDSSETAFPLLCSRLDGYQCNISSRAGRTSSKEQYGVIYKNGITISGWEDFNPDAGDRWERPPLRVDFTANGSTFTLYTIHIKPEAVGEELAYLEDVVNTSGTVLVIGDLNADCNYYNSVQESDFDSWHWIIGNNEDTTSGASNCAYDRIILNDAAFHAYRQDGIWSDGITPVVSDHYLVWSTFVV